MITRKSIFIVGTDHGYHATPSGSPMSDGAERFHEFLLASFDRHAINGIVEEMHEQALRWRQVEESLGQRLSRETGLPHLFCDPDSGEREALGIQDANELTVRAMLEDWNEEEEHFRKTESYAKREA